MQIHPKDNVEVRENGHKYALVKIKSGENIIKYGFPIGHATCDIEIGEHVHTHNAKTNLEGKLEYTYSPIECEIKRSEDELFFEGYVRENGDVGIRNDIWIVNTVGCVNKTAQRLAQITGAKYFSHPYGCSQLGDDQELTQKILAAMVNHPNCGGALVQQGGVFVFQTCMNDVFGRRILQQFVHFSIVECIADFLRHRTSGKQQQQAEKYKLENAVHGYLFSVAKVQIIIIWLVVSLSYYVIYATIGH